MKFHCFEVRVKELQDFNSKAEAMAHLRQHPSHRVMTKHCWSEMSFGKLCGVCGSIIKEEDFEAMHRCPGVTK